MAFYTTLQDARFSSTVAISVALWNGTRGKAIMDQLAISTEPMPFIEDRIAVAMDLYHQAMQGHWTWRPSGASAAGGGLLDDSDMAGECAQLVSGFKTLLRAPAPYGFALTDLQVSSEEWPKANVLLFVVNHARTYFGLYPNVLKPDWTRYGGAARFQGLYAWGNHKVLKVDCGGKFRYFDPCYNQVYLLPEEMADWTLTQSDTALAGRVPVVSRYRGRDRYGRPVTFNAVGSATPDILRQNVRTVDGNYPVLIGPM
jgi:hypothetical protein